MLLMGEGGGWHDFCVCVRVCVCACVRVCMVSKCLGENCRKLLLLTNGDLSFRVKVFRAF